MSTIESRYLTLLGKSLLNKFYLDNELRIQYLLECIEGKSEFNDAVFLNVMVSRGEQLERLRKWREMGWIDNAALSKVAYSRTMLGRERLYNIEYCIKEVIRDDVPGDLIECGVWRGGGSIFMKGVLVSLNDNERAVWVADSFQGLPKPTEEEDLHLDLSKDTCPHLAVSKNEVEQAFKDYELLDERVHFLEGWFKDTLSSAPIERLAVLRLDGDLYESTRDVLLALYDKVSPGGYIIVDDYFIPACRKAVTEFREAHGIMDEIVEIDWTGVYWRKLH